MTDPITQPSSPEPDCGPETIQLLMIVRDGAALITPCLESYLGQVDRFVILDTGSIDNTIELIYKFKRAHSQKVYVYTQLFMGFAESRNALMNLACNTNFTYNDRGRMYDWSVMVDDSYHLVGSLRDSLISRFDAKLYTVKIGNVFDSSTYTSARVFRTKYVTSQPYLRYVGDVHEYLNYPPQGVFTDFILVDVPCAEHRQRTFKRNINDLKLLRNKDDESTYYYIAMTKYNMLKNGLGCHKEVFRALLERAQMGGEPEERMFSIIALGGLCERMKEDPTYKDAGVGYYLLAAQVFPARMAECYFYAYLLGGCVKNLEVAYQNRRIDYNAVFRFPFCNELYGNDGHIAKAWGRHLLMTDIRAART